MIHMLKWIKSHKLVSLLIFILVSISLILSASSLIVAWGINHFLKDYASDVSIGKLELSLWDSDLRIENLSAKDLHGKTLRVGGFYIDWDFGSLWDNYLVIHQVDLHIEMALTVLLFT